MNNERVHKILRDKYGCNREACPNCGHTESLLIGKNKLRDEEKHQCINCKTHFIKSNL